jgi:hypothetical protein
MNSEKLWLASLTFHGLLWVVFSMEQILVIVIKTDTHTVIEKEETWP